MLSRLVEENPLCLPLSLGCLADTSDMVALLLEVTNDVRRVRYTFKTDLRFRSVPRCSPHLSFISCIARSSNWLILALFEKSLLAVEFEKSSWSAAIALACPSLATSLL